MSQSNTGKSGSDNRKVRILYIPAEEILEFMRSSLRAGNDLVLPDIGSVLPGGCEIVDVEYRFERRAFGFIVMHPDFLPIKECEVVPALQEYEQIKLKVSPTGEKLMKYHNYTQAEIEAGRTPKLLGEWMKEQQSEPQA